MNAASETPVGWAVVGGEHSDYLSDESRKRGQAETVSFPVGPDDVARDLAAAMRLRVPVTIQGARTGITAGSVPRGGHVLNLSRMGHAMGLRRRLDGYTLTVEAGMPLAVLREAIVRGEFPFATGSGADGEVLKTYRAGEAHFFAPDPTETSASVGGMIACNASGARSFRYGATRRHVLAIDVALSDGDCLRLQRGRERARTLGFDLQTRGGRRIVGELPRYTMPAVKNASGYYAVPGMDMLDLFIGAEGTLGVVTRAELLLLPAPGWMGGVMVFAPDLVSAVALVAVARRLDPPPAAIEYFDRNALAFVERHGPEARPWGTIPAGTWGVYLEFHGGADAADRAMESLAGILDHCGLQDAPTWIGWSESEQEVLKQFRHALPESVNRIIAERKKVYPGLTKLGTDFAVPDGCLERVLGMYRSELERGGLEHVVFGHIGDNHVHVNILPRDMAEYDAGRRLYLNWAHEVVRMGGTISAEHGVGKLKTGLLAVMYGAQGIAEMRRVKSLFDPDGRLNPGNLFDPVGPS